MDNRERIDIYMNDLALRRQNLSDEINVLSNDSTKPLADFINRMDEILDEINKIDLRTEFLKIAYDSN